MASIDFPIRRYFKGFVCLFTVSQLCCAACFVCLQWWNFCGSRLSSISGERGGWWYRSFRWMGDKLGLTVEEMPFTSPPPPPQSAHRIMLLAEDNQYTHLLFQPLFSVSVLSLTPLVDVIFFGCSLFHSNSIPASSAIPEVSGKTPTHLIKLKLCAQGPGEETFWLKLAYRSGQQWLIFLRWLKRPTFSYVVVWSACKAGWMDVSQNTGSRCSSLVWNQKSTLSYFKLRFNLLRWRSS